MLKTILLFFVLGISFMAYSQTLTLTNIESNEPIELVSIMSDHPNAFTTTNTMGQADISAFQGSNKIEIRRLGYKTEIKSFEELSASNYLINLTPSSAAFDEVVVSATRWNQSSSNTPSKISSITPKDVALNNPQTAADLLGSSGEVFIQKSQQGGGSPMIRGFATNRLLYTIDGVRMNSAIFRAGNLQNVISLDPFAIQKTEVFFGPGSVIYGSDAIGGVMSFQTIQPQLSLQNKTLVKGKAVSRFSSANNEFSNHFDINVGGKKWSSVSSFTSNKFGDLQMGAHGPAEYLKPFYVQRIDNIDQVIENPKPQVQNPSGYSQINMMQKVRFSPNNYWDFQYGFHYSKTSAYSRYDRLIETQPNGLPVSAVWNYGPQLWMMNHLSILHQKDTKIYDKLAIQLAQQTFEESRIDRRFNHHRLRTNLENVQAFSMNVDLEKNIQKHRLFYGAEYVLNDVNSLGSAVDIRDGSPIAVADRYPASTWNSYALYFNYQYFKSDRFLIQAGLRHGIFEIQSDFSRHLAFFPFDFTKSNLQNAATTGSVGMVLRPAASWKISASLGSGFRAPNVDDIGKIFDFAEGEVVVPNTSLKAEYAYNAELNVAKVLGEIAKLDISLFYTYLDNAMVRRSFQVGGQDSILYDGQNSKVYAIQNAAFAKVYGFNIGLEIKLPSGFGLASKYNYQIGKEEFDNGQVYPSRHAAPAFCTTKLSYQKNKINMQFYVVYNAEVSHANLNEEERQKPVIYAKDATGKPFSPSWYTLNFKTMYEFTKAFTISAGLENITDQRYRPYSSGLVAPGRNVIVALTAKI